MKKEKFIRYGKLKPVKQKGYNSYDANICFHTPPKGKGFYAFPYGYEELFLVFGLPSQFKLSRALPKITKYDKYYKEDDDKGAYETIDIWLQKRTFEVSSDKLIWHHLDEYIKDKSLLLKQKDSWCLTTISVWKKAFILCLNKQKMKQWRELKTNYFKDKPLSINELKPGGWYSKDHLEVFFDYKV